MARSIESQRNWLINGVWFAAFLLTGPVVAATGNALDMRQSIERSRMSPADLEGALVREMLNTGAGVIMGLLGAALLVLCLIKLKRLKRAEMNGPKDDEPKW
jgi:hypothetical protein